ncbi:MAG TPA: hypothetical protein VGM81_14325 [Burkholderiaceae bacterium]|jgi:hypothetical protein
MIVESFLGKKILVGLTYLGANGEVREQRQLHGVISDVGEHALNFEQANGSGAFSIPFDGQLDAADSEAVYTLRSTGEAVTGVDFVASFTIHPPVSE